MLLDISIQVRKLDKYRSSLQIAQEEAPLFRSLDMAECRIYSNFFHQDEAEIAVNMSTEDLQEKYNGNLNSEMTGPLHNLIAKVRNRCISAPKQHTKVGVDVVALHLCSYLGFPLLTVFS